MKTSKLKYFVFGLVAVILAAFVALSLTGCLLEEDPDDKDPDNSKHDVDSALYGTWKNSAGSLTVTFSSDGIVWGGNVGSSYNNLPVDKWTAKNGAITTTYQGSTTTVWNYVKNSDELELTSPTTGTKHTLYKEGSASASKHDIDTALYGKYEKENDSNSLTIEFSSGGIYWGGTVGSMYNNLSVDKWTAKNGQITTTYQGSTTTVWNYSISSGNLVLTSPNTPATHTLVKTEGISGDYYYKWPATTTVTITGYTGSGGALTIPSTIDGKPVTAIGNGAFYSKGLTSVTIPSSVTSISNGAFSGNPLTNITVDPGNTVYSSQNLFLLSKDGKELFDYFGSSKSITIPNGVTTIGDRMFYRYGLTSVTIPNSVTTIGEGAFWDNQLTSVTIPNGVTTIGEGAFAQNKLTSVTIGNSVTTIGSGAFAQNKLTNVTIPNSVTTIGSYAFNDNQLTSVTIGSGVTTIGDRAFWANELTSVTIPNSVTTIGGYVFAYNQLTSVTIGANVTLSSNSDHSFPGDFDSVYNPSKQAGTYIFTGTINLNISYAFQTHTGSWSKQNP